MQKKTLIFADGVVANIFLQKVVEHFFGNNLYIAVCKNAQVLPQNLPSSMEAHIFDYTSEFRVSEIFSDIYDVFIIIDDPNERFAVYRIIRKLDEKIRIVLFNNHEFTESFAQGGESAMTLREDLRLNSEIDKNLTTIDSEHLVANRLTQRLENVPLHPRGFGLEQGELLEVLIPPSSVFAYRHIGSISQKKWRIVGVYRSGELILSTHQLVIKPNDMLLAAGDPKTLSDIYRQAKSTLGQFPAPFGRDICLYASTKLSQEKKIISDIEQGIFLHSKIKSSRLMINVFGVQNPAFAQKLASFQNLDKKISVEISQKNVDLSEQMRENAGKKFGLIVINSEIFSKYKVRKALFEIGTPIFKTAQSDLRSVKKSFLIINEESSRAENAPGVMFDVSRQLDLSANFYDFSADGAHNEMVLESIEAQAKIFSQRPNIMKTDSKNPVVFLRSDSENFLQFIPFSQNIAKLRITTLGSMDAQLLSSKSDKNPQVFVPI